MFFQHCIAHHVHIMSQILSQLRQLYESVMIAKAPSIQAKSSFNTLALKIYSGSRFLYYSFLVLLHYFCHPHNMTLVMDKKPMITNQILRRALKSLSVKSNSNMSSAYTFLLSSIPLSVPISHNSLSFSIIFSNVLTTIITKNSNLSHRRCAIQGQNCMLQVCPFNVTYL